MITKCLCGNFVDTKYKMCTKCGANISFYRAIKNDTIFVEMGKSTGVLYRYVIRNGEIVELIPATTHRQRRKFVADKSKRKVRKLK